MIFFLSWKQFFIIYIQELFSTPETLSHGLYIHNSKKSATPSSETIAVGISSPASYTSWVIVWGKLDPIAVLPTVAKKGLTLKLLYRHLPAFPRLFSIQHFDSLLKYPSGLPNFCWKTSARLMEFPLYITVFFPPCFLDYLFIIIFCDCNYCVS